MRNSVGLVGVLAGAAVLVAACGSGPSSGGGKSSSQETPASTGSTSSAATTGFRACMVTDIGGIDDRSFNASSWQGVLDAESAYGVTGKYLQSTSGNDYVPNMRTFISEHCGIIVTVGFLMGNDTQAEAKANPNQKFAIVDYSYSPPVKNIEGLVFNTAQSGFLGGYLAAGMTKTNKVATFGGQKLPTVTIYMDGFYDGVMYYNKVNHKNVQVLGWNEKTQNGTFTNDFTDQTKGLTVTQAFIQQGADIIFPVAGNVGLGAAKAAQESGGKAHLLWVDTDGCVSAPQYCSLFISSVEKGIAVAVKSAIGIAKNGGSFGGTNYVGTLANNGVGIAPYHDWASKVPASLQAAITRIRQAIISGTIKVVSPSQP